VFLAVSSSIPRRPPPSPLFPYTTLFRSSRALVSEVLPALQALAPTPPGRRWLAGMGASLGALAVLAAASTAPASFGGQGAQAGRSEEHTSELQSRRDLVCRLLLEKKKRK